MQRSNKVSDIYLAAKQLVPRNDSREMPVEILVEDTVDGKITHVYAISWDESLNYLAAKLKSMDLELLSVVIVCQMSNHCMWLKAKLEERDVKDILACHHPNEIKTIRQCWPYLMYQKVLIIGYDLIDQMQLGNKTIDVLVLDNIPEAGFQNLSDDILSFSHLRFQMDNCITSYPDQTAYGVSHANVKNTGWYNINRGVMAFSRFPLIHCDFITGVSGISIKIRTSMMKHYAIDKARKVQRFAWSHLSYGHSMIMIGHEKCGKSWSFVPILSQRIYNAIKMGNFEWAGPICIAVVVNMSEGEILSKIMRKMLDFCSTDCGNVTKVVTLWNSSCITEVSKILCRPCGILIITMELLLQLQQLERPGYLIFDPMHLRSIVVDNLDNMHRINPIKFVKLFNWLMEKFRFNMTQTQLIITSRLWMEELMRSQLMTVLPSILIIFEDGLEASAYGGIEINLKFVSDIDHDKGMTLLRKLNDCNLKKERIVVVCHKTSESQHLSELLSANRFPHTHYNPTNTIIKKMQYGMKGIIIITDDMLPYLKCGYIDLLICYTLTNSWHRYKTRFNLFYANYKTPEKSPASALIIFNENDTKQAWLFCDFLLKHDLTMQHEWFDHLYEFCLQEEIIEPRPNVSLCTQLVSYGNCYRRSCRYRHRPMANEIELPNYLPNRGRIFFNILDCTSPTTLIVKPLVYHDPPYPKIYQNISMPNGVHAYYRQKVNRIPLKNLSIGVICIVESKNCYQRAAIVGFASDVMVCVRPLDWDVKCMEISKTELYECHAAFSAHMSQAIELRLTGIMPYSMDRLWTIAETRYVRHKFFRLPSDTIYCANIDFGINHVLFVNTVYSNNGADLKAFLLNRMNVYDDIFVKNRFIDLSIKAL
ncbi:putative ATP-dependent RNA helicase SoYb [Drosophila tropicalis]|uniref:putative ATP-dependent RNA helicase SoYb n=1 Tax=Drosophila tropicalis TaxID=46794 RepID=UPI0035ABCB2B